MSAAVIDIGSGSVRLLLGGVKTTVMTKLGEGLNASGTLSPAAISRTVAAIKDFAQTASLAGAKIFAFATEAVRAASNRAEFINAVSEACGVRIEVVSGYEEAEMALLGACPGGTATVVDIGGASVEIVCGDEGKVTYAKSLPLGMVRLTEQADGNAEMLRAYAATGLAKYGDVPSRGETVGVGGTFTSLAAMAQGLETYDPAAVQDFVLTREKAGELAEELITLDTPENIGAKYPLLPKMRCELIKAGAIFVCELMDYLRICGVRVSEADNLDGYYRYKHLDEE